MKKNRISLKTEGVFFHKDPLELSIQIYRELLAIFFFKRMNATGIILKNEQVTLPQFIDYFNELMRTNALTFVSPEDIQLKLFGLAEVSQEKSLSILSWAKKKGISFIADDTGRSVQRNLVIHCASGQVGVRYKETNTKAADIFVAAGTYRERMNHPPIRHKILILSTNRVKRFLAKQAIEENEGFIGDSIDDPKTLLQRDIFRSFPWSDVCIFEDSSPIEKIEKFIKRVNKANPRVRFAWISDSPLGLQKKGFPITHWAFEGESELKNNLKDFIYSDSLPVIKTGDVIPLGKKRKT